MSLHGLGTVSAHDGATPLWRCPSYSIIRGQLVTDPADCVIQEDLDHEGMTLTHPSGMGAIRAISTPQVAPALIEFRNAKVAANTLLAWASQPRHGCTMRKIDARHLFDVYMEGMESGCHDSGFNGLGEDAPAEEKSCGVPMAMGMVAGALAGALVGFFMGAIFAPRSAS